MKQVVHLKLCILHIPNNACCPLHTSKNLCTHFSQAHESAEFILGQSASYNTIKPTHACAPHSSNHSSQPLHIAYTSPPPPTLPTSPFPSPCTHNSPKNHSASCWECWRADTCHMGMHADDGVGELMGQSYQKVQVNKLTS